ncbi:hypothetical protein HETIRDRAFT_328861, partial [Heterobasidion irregulare TC 32-1]
KVIKSLTTTLVSSLDAHDGHIQYFDGKYVLYGTSYDCGFRWMNPVPTSENSFCGIKVYTSPDLVSWSYEGYAYDKEKYPNPAFRPKVEYRNAYGHTLGSVGDFAVQQDENSTVWIAYSSNFFGNATLEKMTDDWLNGSGIASAIPVTFVEAHGMTVVDNEWYWTFGSLCGYCNSTDTSFVTASSPFGPWSERQYISEDSCGGQSSFLTQVPNPSGGYQVIYGSDLWLDGSTNQARAALHLEPVSVGNGTIGNLTCPDSFDLDIVVGNETSSSSIDATSGMTGFDYACDLPPSYNLQSGARIQAWTVGRSGNLSEVGFSIGQHNSDGSLSVQLFSFQNDSDLFGSADYAVAISPPQGFFLFPNNTMNNWNWLANDTFLATNTSWALQNYVLRPNVTVQAGDRLALILRPRGTLSPYCYACKNATGKEGHLGLVRQGGAAINPTSSPAVWLEDGKELKFYTVVE